MHLYRFEHLFFTQVIYALGFVWRIFHLGSVEVFEQNVTLWVPQLGYCEWKV